MASRESERSPMIKQEEMDGGQRTVNQDDDGVFVGGSDDLDQFFLQTWEKSGVPIPAFVLQM